MTSKEQDALDLADCLLTVGVYVLSPTKRQDLAQRLSELPVSPPQIVRLRDYLARMCQDVGHTQRTLAGIVVRVDILLERLTDMEEHLRRNPRVMELPAVTAPGEADRKRTAQKLAQERAENAGEWRIMQVGALHRGDRKSPDEIALVLGLTEQDVREAIAAYDAMHTRVPPTKRSVRIVPPWKRQEVSS